MSPAVPTLIIWGQLLIGGLTGGRGHIGKQDAEKVRQRRSRIVQILNRDPAASPLGGAHRLGAPYSSHRAPQRVRLGPSLAAALLDGLFEHPVHGSSIVQDVRTIEILFCLV